jgi:hypothetical protein
MATETREVNNFHRVHMQDFGMLEIAQGAQESLTVEADEETLKRIFTEVEDGTLTLRVGRDWLERLRWGLQTSLTRPRIRYHLTVKNLSELVVAGFGRVTVGDLASENLAVHLSGGGDVSFKALTADRLTVELAGAGRVQTAGKVKEQQVTFSGAGKYAGGKLESQQARVTMSGAGSATVWAVEDLDVTITGMGSVEYIGSPAVRKSVAGMGSITHLGGG